MKRVITGCAGVLLISMMAGSTGDAQESMPIDEPVQTDPRPVYLVLFPGERGRPRQQLVIVVGVRQKGIDLQEPSQFMIHAHRVDGPKVSR